MKLSVRKILLVDDDVDLSAVIADMLRSYGYDTRIVASCEEAYEALTNETFALIVLDINLPDGTGYEVCRELRGVSRIPVIFASARNREEDLVKGLDIGGDDYLAKPYSMKELLARINALMRRTWGGEEKAAVYRIKNISVDTGMRVVKRNGSEVKLSLKEFDVLSWLCEHRNETVSKDELLRGVWGVFSEAEPSTVAVHIRWLREKLEADPAKPALIKTVWGIGYRLEA